MLRRLVRFYFRLRYYPRRVSERLASHSEMLTGIVERLDRLSAAVAGLHKYEATLIGQLMSAHEERLARVHEEVAAFCDDAIRAMMTVSTNIADIDTRMASLQRAVQRVDNGLVDGQARLASLQEALKRLHDQIGRDPALYQAESSQRADTAPSQMHGARAEPGQPAHLPALPAGAPPVPNRLNEVAGDDARLSRV